MCKKILSFILIGLLLNLICYSTAMANPDKADKFAAKVKTAIAKLGVGKESRVKIKLKDKTELNGYISEVGKDNFVVIDNKTDTAVEIPYSQAKQVKGKNNLTGDQILIGIGIAVLIGIIIFAISGAD